MDLRVSAYAVITDGAGRMLLPHLNESENLIGWTLPGGGIDPGEDPADAAVREVFEETGYHAMLDGLLGVDNLIIPGERRLSHAKKGIPMQALRIIYSARVISGELTVEAEGSTDGVSWFTQPEIDDLQRVSLVDVGRRLAGLMR